MTSELWQLVFDDDVQEWRDQTSDEINGMDMDTPSVVESIVKAKLHIEKDMTAMKIQTNRNESEQ